MSTLPPSSAMQLLLSILFLAPLLIFLSAILYSTFRSSKKSTASRECVPCYSLLDLLRNRHRLLDWTSEILAASPTGTVSTFMGVITANPSNVEHMLKAHFDNYPKGFRSTFILSDFLGAGIFNSDGDHWRLQRKTASLEFNTKTIRTFILQNVRHAVADRLLVRLSRAATTGEVVDIQGILGRLEFDNACKVIFNADPACLHGEDDDAVREFSHAFEDAVNLTVQRFRHPFLFAWKMLRLLGLGSERVLKGKMVIVHRFVSEVIRARKKAGPAALGDDLLSRFIADADYSDEFLRDIVISFVLAGRDTTSGTLAWFFWLISTRPEVQEGILNEIRRVRRGRGSFSECDDFFSLEELRGMDYLHAALTETLRLYPAVPLEQRECAADDVWPDGTRVAKRRTVMYNSYAMGRMAVIWGADWGEFRPERWLDKNGVFRTVSPFRFPVFHAGPRMCLGKDMAYIQMKAVAASVLERFELEMVDKEKEREKELIMFLKIKDGLPLWVRERAGTPAEVN